MIKNLRNKNVLRAVGAVLMVCFMAVSSVNAATITAVAAVGNWSATGSWVGGVVPVSTDDVIVPAGATIAVDVPVTISASLKNTGGVVTGGVNLTIAGTYEHAMNAGSIPTATWSDGSTLKITGMTTTIASGMGTQSFYNIIYDCPSSTGTTTNFGFAPATANVGSQTIRGDLTINNVGTGITHILRLTSVVANDVKTITINGNLTIAPTTSLATFQTTGSGQATATVTVNVKGNLTIAGASSGPASYNFGASSTPCTLNLEGNLILSGTSATNKGSLAKGSGLGTLNFSKPSGTQTFTRGANTEITCTSLAVNVKSGATLDMGTSIFKNESVAGTTSGAATFTVEANAGLKLGDLAGITTSGTTGNVQVSGVRTYTAGSNYEYKGSAAQVTGTGLPATVNNLTINNTGGGTGVTLTATTTVTNALTLTSGNITLGMNDLTAATVTGGSTTSHVVTDGTGYLKSAFGGGDTKTFPIGATASSYDPVSITSANAVTFSTKVKAALSNVAGTRDPTLILKKEWDLSPSATPGSTNLAFTADAASLNGNDAAFTFPAAGSAVLGHWNSITGTYDANITASFASRTWTITGYSGTFSPFIAAAPGAVLSIDLQNLAVRGRGTTNSVSWSTASEKNNAAFNIERSADGQDFTTIGTLKGKGTTTSLSTYDFTDNTPLTGINYYRLRSIDNDGKATLSKSVSIVNGKTTTGILKAYPLVSNAILTVDVVTEGVSTLNIVDLTGKTVLTKTIKGAGFSSNPIDVSGLSNGLYVLMFTSSSVQMVQKFVKN